MSKQTAITATCHCKAITVTIKNKPSYINDCNCSLCTNSGAIWGYYKADDVVITGDTVIYVRADRSNPAVQAHSCKICSATTHWTLTEAFAAQNKDVSREFDMGVNMRLFDDDALIGCELRFPDGKAWDGLTPYTYRKDSIIL